MTPEQVVDRVLGPAPEPRRSEAGPGLHDDPPRAGRQPGEDDDEPRQLRPRPRIFAPVPVGDLYRSTAEEVEWLLHGLIPCGAFVLLAAFMKAGKTTLLYALLARLLRGEPFLDRETRRVPVLLLAVEESKRDVKRRLKRFGVAQDAPLYLQFKAIPTTPGEWGALVAFVRERGIKLIVLDTLARCWPVWGVDNENDNARVSAAIAPLLELCREDGVTVMPLHHTGKLAEGAGFGREVRGAGAILALCDQALLLDRHRSGESSERILRTLGRYEESPAELVLGYDRSTGEYSVIRTEDADPQARSAERLAHGGVPTIGGSSLIDYIDKQPED